MTENKLSDRNIVVALSGGGFRASLFHLGVIRFLRDSRILHRVESISSISGGSITGAHCVLRWDELTGTEEQFLRVIDDFVAFAKADVRGRILRRWLLARCCVLPWLLRGYRFSLTGLLIDEYSSLYGISVLKDLEPKPGQLADRPRLYIGATSLTSGDLCCFDSEGLTVFHRGGEARIATGGALPLSLAVASSSAFPPLFPPVRIDNEVLRCDARLFPTAEWLTDGGVLDNLGLELCFAASPDSKASRLILVSNASGGADWRLDPSVRGPVNRNVRANDLLMERNSSILLEATATERMAVISLSTVVSANDGGMSPEVQRALRRIRTDLDAFSNEEIGGLIRQGYLAARVTLQRSGFAGELHDANHALDPAEGVKQVAFGAPPKTSERVRFRLWNSRDWCSWALAAVVLAWLLLGALAFRRFSSP
ncbi:MAG: patatin-like phospholipase family protein [Acidobacteria bacterium]|nr:patatin-like phospholipase family protein [Acidobacteriota bacterium]